MKGLSPKQYPTVIDEMANVQVYLLRLATKLDVNILEVIEQKMAKNAAKYPAKLVRGSTKKYTEYEQNIAQENSDDAIKS
jgi:dCTP diphosphatase